MDNQHAKPGDTIEITWYDEFWCGQRLKVVERPSDKMNGCQPGDAWFISKNGHTKFFGVENYTIVESGRSSPESVEDVDASLKRQRDDNLRSIFV